VKNKPEQLNLTSLLQSPNDADSGDCQVPAREVKKPVSLSRARFERSRDILIERLEKSGIFPSRKA